MSRLGRHFLGFVLMLGCALASAQQPAADAAARRELAGRVMQQIGFDKLLDSMIEQMAPAMAPLLEQALKASGAPEVQRKEFITRFPANFRAEMKKPEVLRQYTEAVVGMLANDYSLEELQALSSFYATPLAQKMLAKQPAQMQLMMAHSTRIGELAGRRAAETTLEQMGVTRR